eukprot:COSAG05_NODE_63_length_22889_cov_41.986617_14_plen_220_part_00
MPPRDSQPLLYSRNAIVWGLMSFVDKISNGAVIMLCQAFAPLCAVATDGNDNGGGGGGGGDGDGGGGQQTPPGVSTTAPLGAVSVGVRHFAYSVGGNATVLGLNPASSSNSNAYLRGESAGAVGTQICGDYFRHVVVFVPGCAAVTGTASGAHPNTATSCARLLAPCSHRASSNSLRCVCGSGYWSPALALCDEAVDDPSRSSSGSVLKRRRGMRHDEM